jgi:hypothetical protein
LLPSQLFTKTAAALPAEIDEHGQLKQPASGLVLSKPG